MRFPDVEKNEIAHYFSLNYLCQFDKMIYNLSLNPFFQG